ncbi:hypothetical protein D9757_011663 [Collybiopsis confluens]|uniref:Cytochrome P450 n=1 Tax=Collybiopsis confluens TaxID=2823264 RepID=A0A8H5LPP7_9AGAR|nr:hypothetical protein D9757_015303 [Collybiopsis confluens]KAF5346368.1 hypothetical protein D9757_014173 [Collybiopsis confluens]KAF5365405.1 hypothetical protein D9757_011663 [Collybiopsis confluens]
MLSRVPSMLSLERPSSFSIAALLIIFATVFKFISLVYLWSKQQRASQHIPGPFLARWTPLWLAYHAYLGRRYVAVHKAHQRFGVMVRITPTHVSIAASDAIPVIYAQGPNAPAKSSFYDAFVCNGKPSLFSTRDRRDHSRKRRVVSHAFSSIALREFVPMIQSSINEFLESMDKTCERGEFFDALPWFNYLAFDILSDLAFGKRIGMGSDVISIQKSPKNAIALVNEREHFSAIIGVYPFLRWAASFMDFLPGRKATLGLENLGRTQVLERLSSGASRNDILGKLIIAYGYDDHCPSNDEVDKLTAESVTLLVAGSDTTSNSLAAIIHFICTHPRVYEKLLRLLEGAATGEKSLNYEKAKDIPYLQATINEGLRLHSTNSIGLHRLAPKGGLVFRGHFFHEGTELSVPAWTISHSQEIWNDPEAFRPERWLEGKELHPYLLSFGKGPRACIGKNLAYMEMTLVIAAILLKYEVEVKSRELETTEGFMHKPLHFWIKLRLR